MLKKKEKKKKKKKKNESSEFRAHSYVYRVNDSYLVIRSIPSLFAITRNYNISQVSTGSADTYIPTRSTHTFALTRLLGCNYVCTDRRGRKGTPNVSPWDALYMYKAVYRPPSGVANGQKGLGRPARDRPIDK